MAKIVNFLFDFGDEVYMKADPDQKVRIVTAMQCRPTGIAYECTGLDTKWCYDFEITSGKNMVTITG